MGVTLLRGIYSHPLGESPKNECVRGVLLRTHSFFGNLSPVSFQETGDREWIPYATSRPSRTRYCLSAFQPTMMRCSSSHSRRRSDLRLNSRVIGFTWRIAFSSWH
jgi:hypothetical protein